MKYGVTADYVRGLEVVLPGGAVMRTGRRTAKGVAGFDLTGLFVGSEGLLGVVTSVVVRLVPAPDPPLTALATFGTLQEAAAGVVALRAERPGPSLIEVLDGPTIDSVQRLADDGFPGGAPERSSSSPTVRVARPRTCSGMRRCSPTGGRWTSPWPTTRRRRTR